MIHIVDYGYVELHKLTFLPVIASAIGANPLPVSSTVRKYGSTFRA